MRQGTKRGYMNTAVMDTIFEVARDAGRIPGFDHFRFDGTVSGTSRDDASIDGQWHPENAQGQRLLVSGSPNFYFSFNAEEAEGLFDWIADYLKFPDANLHIQVLPKYVLVLEPTATFPFRAEVSLSGTDVDSLADMLMCGADWLVRPTLGRRFVIYIKPIGSSAVAQSTDTQNTTLHPAGPFTSVVLHDEPTANTSQTTDSTDLFGEIMAAVSEHMTGAMKTTSQETTDDAGTQILTNSIDTNRQLANERMDISRDQLKKELEARIAEIESGQMLSSEEEEESSVTPSDMSEVVRDMTAVDDMFPPVDSEKK